MELKWNDLIIYIKQIDALYRKRLSNIDEMQLIDIIDGIYKRGYTDGFDVDDFAQLEFWNGVD